jgi:hypothetical protein
MVIHRYMVSGDACINCISIKKLKKPAKDSKS